MTTHNPTPAQKSDATLIADLKELMAALSQPMEKGGLVEANKADDALRLIREHGLRLLELATFGDHPIRAEFDQNSVEIRFLDESDETVQKATGDQNKVYALLEGATHACPVCDADTGIPIVPTKRTDDSDVVSDKAPKTIHNALMSMVNELVGAWKKMSKGEIYSEHGSQGSFLVVEADKDAMVEEIRVGMYAPDARFFALAANIATRMAEVPLDTHTKPESVGRYGERAGVLASLADKLIEKLGNFCPADFVKKSQDKAEIIGGMALDYLALRDGKIAVDTIVNFYELTSTEAPPPVDAGIVDMARAVVELAACVKASADLMTAKLGTANDAYDNDLLHLKHAATIEATRQIVGKK